LDGLNVGEMAEYIGEEQWIEYSKVKEIKGNDYLLENGKLISKCPRDGKNYCSVHGCTTCPYMKIGE
jgi:hypothetical protein